MKGTNMQHPKQTDIKQKCLETQAGKQKSRKTLDGKENIQKHRRKRKSGGTTGRTKAEKGVENGSVELEVERKIGHEKDAYCLNRKTDG